MILALLLSLVSYASAGGGSTTAGDGGVAVWCGSSVELLDFAEARSLSNVSPELTPQLLAKRAQELPREFHDLSARARRLSSQLRFVDQAPRTADWGLESVDSIFWQCTIWQLGHKSPKQLTVSRQLYNSLPVASRYAFVAHEALHEIMISTGPRQQVAAASRQVLIYLSADDEFRGLYRSRIYEVIRLKRPLNWALFRHPNR